MNDPGRILIIGAGPTGVGAARRLMEIGHHDFTIIERSSGPGGLAASVVDDHGFTWDKGGHVQFSHYARYDDLLDSLPIRWLQHERESWIWFKQRFIPYPFQNNIHRLDDSDCAFALSGLEEAAAGRSAQSPPRDFGEWIMQTFGTGIADLFLRPYNQKVWAYPPEMLDASWVGERVAMPDLDRIRTNIRLHRDDVSWGPNNTFRFPEVGGTGAIWNAVAATLPADRFVFGDAVKSVELASGRVRLESGRTLTADTIISSIPVDTLCSAATDLSPEVRAAARELVYSSTHIFGIGLRGDLPAHLARKCWMYFPESHSPYYRVTVFSHYSPRNVPEGPYWSLMAEVSESPMKKVDRVRIFGDVLRALRADRLIDDASEIVSRWHHVERHGYPTPFLNRRAVLERIHRELEASRVFSRGRFGAWKYEVSNQDHSFMQGVELVDRLTTGAEETTLNRPEYANSGALLKR